MVADKFCEVSWSKGLSTPKGHAANWTEIVGFLVREGMAEDRTSVLAMWSCPF